MFICIDIKNNIFKLNFKYYLIVFLYYKAKDQLLYWSFLLLKKNNINASIFQNYLFS